MGRSELHIEAHKDVMTDTSFFSCNFPAYTYWTSEKHKRNTRNNKYLT